MIPFKDLFVSLNSPHTDLVISCDSPKSKRICFGCHACGLRHMSYRGGSGGIAAATRTSLPSQRGTRAGSTSRYTAAACSKYRKYPKERIMKYRVTSKVFLRGKFVRCYNTTYGWIKYTPPSICAPHSCCFPFFYLHYSSKKRSVDQKSTSEEGRHGPALPRRHCGGRRSRGGDNGVFCLFSPSELLVK